ncbi:MAG: hypothetical protein JXA33_14090 [Anaerolineae bacterium]|nr:hypothetical protein [Anaerolineae bacterium]
MYGMTPESLQKMYVKGSLKNQDAGFVFQVKNLVDSGAVSGIAKLIVDGEEKSLDGITVEMGGKVRPVAEISWSSSLYVYYGATMTIYVPGPLEAGEHTITFTVKAPELGSLSLPITDTVA